MTKKRMMLVYLAAFVLALPITFPAALIERFVALPPTISHAPVQGSLLGVSVDWLQVGGVRLAEVEAEPVLMGLFSDTPLAVAVGKPLPLKARVGGGGERLVITDVATSVQFDTLRELLKLPGIGIDARISVDVVRAELVGERCESLSGEVVLSEFEGQDFAGVGEISAALTCTNGNLIVTLSPDNSLRLAGSATITPQGRYQVNMTAEPPQGPLFDLFLDFLGQPRDGRRFQINLRS